MSIRNLFGLIKKKPKLQPREYQPANIQFDDSSLRTQNELDALYNQLVENRKNQIRNYQRSVDFGDLEVVNVEQVQPEAKLIKKETTKSGNKSTNNTTPSIIVVPISKESTFAKPRNYAGSSPMVYRVKAGDTLTQIAKNSGLTLEQLILLNGLKHNDVIREGDVLAVGKMIPGKEQPSFESRNLVVLIPKESKTKVKGGSYGGGDTAGGGATYGWTESEWKEHELSDDELAVVTMTFNQAFAAARKRGDKTFVWNGKTYGTELAKGEDAAKLKGKGQTAGAVVIPGDRWAGIKVTKE